jgi:hypothetical protein
MRSLRLIALALTVTLLGAACASGGRSGSARVDRNLVTSEELRQGNSSNLFDFVQTHRPMWLRKRGQTSIMNEGDIVVYLDGAKLGGPDQLRSISVQNTESLQFLDAASAQQRFGVGHNHGAIIIQSMRDSVDDAP